MSDLLGTYYIIRNYKPEDKNFILATFLKGVAGGDSWFSMIPKNIFMDNYKKVAMAMLESQNNVVYTACLKEDPDVVVGYIWLSKDHKTLHWVYVKKDFRDMGIAKSLIPNTIEVVSHMTALGKKLKDKLGKVIFNPFNVV